ncbi:MAG: hypothetical protein H0U94_05770 [Acidobacteria bacterium]|nr:hypothetical protein [Acidobacteriota bacterium]
MTFGSPDRRTHDYRRHGTTSLFAALDVATGQVIHALPIPGDSSHVRWTTPWTFARTYAATWPHEYVVRNAENAAMIFALARHIFEHGVEGRFYSQVRKYHHEDGKVYWSMANAPEEATLINRCNEDQTYESRLATGTLPRR